MSKLTIVLSEAEKLELRKQAAFQCRNQRAHARYLVLRGLGLAQPDQAQTKNNTSAKLSTAGAGVVEAID